MMLGKAATTLLRHCAKPVARSTTFAKLAVRAAACQVDAPTQQSANGSSGQWFATRCRHSSTSTANTASTADTTSQPPLDWSASADVASLVQRWSLTQEAATALFEECAAKLALNGVTSPASTLDYAGMRLLARHLVAERKKDGVRESLPKLVVLFLCGHNAGRSQMAASWAQHLGGSQVVAFSGGSTPSDAVNPMAVAAMAQVGVVGTSTTACTGFGCGGVWLS